MLSESIILTASATVGCGGPVILSSVEHQLGLLAVIT